ncbi:unnamed protein product [Ectocarpus sp. 12 AP-2014]
MSFYSMARYILKTPMNYEGNHRSAAMVHSANHHAEEMNRALVGSEFIWDNARPRSRQGQRGDLFGFVYTSGDCDEIDIRVILEVGTTQDRRAQWDEDIPDHSDRAAIVLSDSIGWIRSSELASSQSNAPVRPNGKMLTSNGTACYTWDSDIPIRPYVGIV